MKKTFTTLIYLVLLTVTAAATLLYLNERENRKKCLGEKEFIDTGLGIEFSYPCDWELTLNTETGSEQFYDEAESTAGPIAKRYEIKLEKNGSMLKINKVFTAVEGSVRSFDYEDNFVVINDALLRYLNDRTNEWTYVKYLNCEDVPDVFGGTGEACGELFFPQFGNSFETSVTARPASEDELEEIDEIVRGL